MKRTTRILAAVCAAVMLLSLFACTATREAQIRGVWHLKTPGTRLDGSPLADAAVLTFDVDEQGVLRTADGEEIAFTYALTDNTLTVRFDDFSFGILYAIDRDSMLLGGLTERGGALFERY